MTADRFIDETLELIAEKGGSQEVNLREIARRIGCAHTNAYNYFVSFDELLWAAFRRGLKRYGEYLVHDLCSGCIGPVLKIRDQLQTEGDEPIHILLTDKFPHLEAFRRAARARAARCLHSVVRAHPS